MSFLSFPFKHLFYAVLTLSLLSPTLVMGMNGENDEEADSAGVHPNRPAVQSVKANDSQNAGAPANAPLKDSKEGNNDSPSKISSTPAQDALVCFETPEAVGPAVTG